MFLGCRARPVRCADTLATIYELMVSTTDDQLADHGPDPARGLISSGPREVT
jgi:hypothetical protein